MNSRRISATSWANGFWVTRLAVVLGLLVVVVGLADAQLFHTVVFGGLAAGVVALSIVGIIASFWRVRRRSRRLRDPMFWITIALNVVLIGGVSVLLARGLQTKPFAAHAAPDGPSMDNR